MVPLIPDSELKTNEQKHEQKKKRIIFLIDVN